MHEFFLKGTMDRLNISKVIDMFHTITPYGNRIKSTLQPYKVEEIELLMAELQELEKAIAFIHEIPRGLIQEVKDMLMQVPVIDLEIDYLEGKATLGSPMFFNLAKFLFIAARLGQKMQSVKWWNCSNLQWNFHENLYSLLHIRDSYSFYIGDFGDKKYQNLVKELQKLESELNQVANLQERRLLQELDLMEKDFFEGTLTVSKRDKGLIDKLLTEPSLQVSKESFASVTFQRIKTLEELKLENKVSQVKAELSVLESMILDTLSEKTRQFLPYLKDLVDKIGRFDWLLAKAVFAVNYKATVAKVNLKEKKLSITGGIHPVVGAELQKMGNVFTPLSIELGQGVAVLTGANMGGKTVTLKTVGLLLAMVQMGLPVTAESVEFAPFEFMFLSETEERDMVGLSSFGAEIQALNEILRLKNKWGLVLLDELARGTNPAEGAALARALLDTFQDSSCCVLVTTHFDGLTRDERLIHWQVKGLKNLHDLPCVDDIYKNFDYGLEIVSSSDTVPRDALKVASLIGMDGRILQLARQYLQSSEEV